ncbi:MAG: hypothetical protein MUC97_11500 [Bernardetiaceae bacterium]|jgi:hypothetical protein|nr:hypothetical protein [Bernardetiaceae bacterium]
MSILAKFGGSPSPTDDQKRMSFWGEPCGPGSNFEAHRGGGQEASLSQLSDFQYTKTLLFCLFINHLKYQEQVVLIF